MADRLRAEICRALTHASSDNGQDTEGSTVILGTLVELADAVMVVFDAATAAMLHEYADRLDAIDPQCTALTGPVWYGQGWHQAAHHLHDLADDHPGRMRREASR